jgi:uncharacterized protein (DUF1778 family)
MPGQRSPNVIQVNLRLTRDLRKRLVAAAKKAGRSLNAEMVARLESTFRRETADKVLDEAQRILERSTKMRDEAVRMVDNIEDALRAGLTVDDIFPPRNALLRRRKK